jgi:hypothetical protein
VPVARRAAAWPQVVALAWAVARPWVVVALAAVAARRSAEVRAGPAPDNSAASIGNHLNRSPPRMISAAGFFV